MTSIREAPPRSAAKTASHRSSSARTTGSASYRSWPMPICSLPSPAYTNAVLGGAGGLGIPLGSGPRSASSTPFSPSRSDGASRKTRPARRAKWLRPSPAVQAMSASSDRAVPSCAERTSSCSSSHVRYRCATSRSAAGDFPERGRTRVSRGAKSPRGEGSSTALPGDSAGTVHAGPAAAQGASASAEASPSAAPASTTTCAFVPERPKELTPARAGRSGREGQSVGSEMTRTGSWSHSRCGVGLSKWSCFGMLPRFMASTALIRLATPAAHSRWPMLVFTEPISRGRSGLRCRP